MILDHVEIAREAGLPYVYLGYWVPGSPKMGYKAQVLRARGLRRRPLAADRRPRADYAAETHPLSTDPIAEQVANITLPDSRS